MSSLKDVFAMLEQMREQRVVSAYAIGGATAVLFYAEPTRTYDVVVFMTLPAPGTGLASLDPVYAWARARGIPAEGEHLLIHGVPVQLLPACNALVEEAVVEARTHDYEGTAVRVVGPAEPVPPDVAALLERKRQWHQRRLAAARESARAAGVAASGTSARSAAAAAATMGAALGHHPVTATSDVPVASNPPRPATTSPLWVAPSLLSFAP